MYLAIMLQCVCSAMCLVLQFLHYVLVYSSINLFQSFCSTPLHAIHTLLDLSKQILSTQNAPFHNYYDIYLFLFLLFKICNFHWIP